MKKSDIIDTHNALLNKLKTVLDEYKTLTGLDHPKADTLVNQLGPYTMNWGKEFLQKRLDERQNAIITIPQEAELYVKTEELKSSEKGKEFIASLAKRQSDILAEIHNVSNDFVTKFNEMLTICGLEDWEIVTYKNLEKDTLPYILPSFSKEFFDIVKKDMMYARVHIHIGCDHGEWKMSVAAGINGGTVLGENGEEYEQFKAYITICDHAKAFQIWMNDTYNKMAGQMKSLLTSLDKADEAVRDPYAAWVRENS
jgi:hypothetical protein